MIRLIKSAATGNWMALDADPDPELGNVMVVAGAAHVFATPEEAQAKLDEMGRPGQPLFTSHHFTCPKRKARRDAAKTEPRPDPPGQLPLL